MAPQQYDALAVTALRLTADAPLDRIYQVMRFPGRWKEILRQQARTRSGREFVSIPIASLNAAITALVPDCVITMTSVGRGDDDQDWLLAHREINPTAIFAVVAAWIRAQKTKPEHTARTLDQLRPSELTWSPIHIAFGTAEQRARSMRLLPMEIAAILSRPGTSCPHGQLAFRRCPSAAGAELMSWPPLGIEDQLPHSVKIGITAQTLPTSDETYVYLSLGMRRWMPESSRLGGRRHSVYIAPTVPYLAGLENSRHFGTAMIKRGRVDRPDGATEFQPRWDEDLARVLAEAGCLAKLPAPQQLTDKPLDFLRRDGDAAALVYSTGMLTFEGVSAGLSLADRTPVVAWAADLLAPHLKLVDPLPRQKTKIYRGISAATPDRIPPEQISKVVGNRLDVELLTDTDRASAYALRRLSARLGVTLPAAEVLDEHATLVQAGPLTIGVRRPTSATIRADLDRSGERTRTIQAAMEHRVAHIEERLGRASHPTITLVEIAHPDSYQYSRRGDDPKFAIRHGLLRTGRLCQFVTPVVEPRRPPRARANGEPSDANRERFAAAVDDLFRQLGVRPRPLPVPVPGTLDRQPALLALWMIRKDKGRTWGVKRQVPVAVLADPTGEHIQIRTPQVDWQPLHTGLLQIGERHADISTPCSADDFQRFLRDVLDEAVSAHTDTLLLTHAQNLRSVWRSLANSQVKIDTLGLGAGSPLAIQSFPTLRHVRIRTAEDGETPGCFGINEDGTGQPQGLWQFLPPRVFGSTSGKPTTSSGALKGISKIVPTEHGGRPMAPKPNAQVWNPQFIEVFVAGLQTGDRPQDWAALTHDLRSAAPYARDTTILPWPLHLARQVDEYLLPKEIIPDKDEEPDPES